LKAEGLTLNATFRQERAGLGIVNNVFAPGIHPKKSNPSTMITRNWTGVVKPGRSNDYLIHLQNDTLKRLSAIKGFLNASILKRMVSDGIEFLVITHWENMDAIKQFAGEAADIAVVPPTAQEMMVRYDPVVRHYEEVLTLMPVEG
jgi:heme-degrading monooxygenase HmoA